MPAVGQTGPVPVPSELLSRGEVFATIDHPHTTSHGLRTHAGERVFVKTATREHRWTLELAIRFHGAVRAPHVVGMLDHWELADGGLAVVHPWVDGENLNDPAVPGALPRTDPASAASRFIDQGTPVILECLDKIIGAHQSVARQGCVAVDFYDGCILWDFERQELHLVDLDHYRPPYRLDRERQLGSTRFMAPEEFARGAWIDQRTTVFTLGRCVQVLLGPDGRDRIDDRLLGVVLRAIADDPADRHPSVAAFATDWFAARIAEHH